MKTFVYSKKTSKKVATITEVAKVIEHPTKKKIIIVTESGEDFEFDTAQVKTTTYQN